MSDDGKKMLEYCKKTSMIKGVNAEAKSLFSAIQQAFTVTDKEFLPVPIDLIAMLAACSWVALEYNKDKEIPFTKAEHDYILIRAANNFVHFIHP